MLLLCAHNNKQVDFTRQMMRGLLNSAVNSDQDEISN